MSLSIKISSEDLVKLEQVKRLILDDITRHHTIAALSLQSELKESKLKAGFKSVYGESIYGFLKNQRLKRAIHLLSTSEYSIRVIAAKCGFAHATNFIAVFQKRFKVKPSHYRRSHLITKTLLPGKAKTCYIDSPVVTLYPLPAQQIMKG
jgi:AraC-like DNA-binding protein